MSSERTDNFYLQSKEQKSLQVPGPMGELDFFEQGKLSVQQHLDLFEGNERCILEKLLTQAPHFVNLEKDQRRAAIHVHDIRKKMLELCPESTIYALEHHKGVYCLAKTVQDGAWLEIAIPAEDSYQSREDLLQLLRLAEVRGTSIWPLLTPFESNLVKLLLLAEQGRVDIFQNAPALLRIADGVRDSDKIKRNLSVRLSGLNAKLAQFGLDRLVFTQRKKYVYAGEGSGELVDGLLAVNLEPGMVPDFLHKKINDFPQWVQELFFGVNSKGDSTFTTAEHAVIDVLMFEYPNFYITRKLSSIEAKNTAVTVSRINSKLKKYGYAGQVKIDSRTGIGYVLQYDESKE